MTLVNYFHYYQLNMHVFVRIDSFAILRPFSRLVSTADRILDGSANGPLIGELASDYTLFREWTTNLICCTTDRALGLDAQDVSANIYIRRHIPTR